MRESRKASASLYVKVGARRKAKAARNGKAASSLPVKAQIVVGWPSLFVCQWAFIVQRIKAAPRTFAGPVPYKNRVGLMTGRRGCATRPRKGNRKWPPRGSDPHTFLRSEFMS